MAENSVKPRVAVLLATYNGMVWIDEQVRSILNQLGVDVTVFVSDDQSSDGTLNWCLSLADEEPRVIVLPVLSERFGGAARNFFRLVRDVDFSGFDYIAYADQDDIWLPDKLITAHRSIVAKCASAYSGNVVAFWPDGREQLLLKAQPTRRYDFLFEAAGPGCSYVLKISEAEGFRRFLIEHWDCANAVALHDWLTYAWFRSNGHRWYIDPLPKMRYRQHGGNQVGANSGVSAIFRRLLKIRSGWYRNECSKVASLVVPYLSDAPRILTPTGRLSRRFLLLNIGDARRRVRDRAVLLVAVLSGLF